jgi:hypothetical protein
MSKPPQTAERMVSRQVQLWGMQQTSVKRGARLPVITISRQYGCNGWSLAEALGQRLSCEQWEWLVYGRELLAEIASDMNVSTKLLEGFADGQLNDLRDYLETTFGVHPETLTLFHRIVKNILVLGRKGGVIIVGRGANFITRDISGSLHFRIVAEREWRIARVSNVQQVSTAEAERLVNRSDSTRRSFIHDTFNRSIDDPLGYTLVLNNQLLDSKAMIKLVTGMVCTQG